MWGGGEIVRAHLVRDSAPLPTKQPCIEGASVESM
jgi:hypothetical protein